MFLLDANTAPAGYILFLILIIWKGDIFLLEPVIPIFGIIFLTFLTIVLPIHWSCISVWKVHIIIDHKQSSQYNIDLEKFYITRDHCDMVHNTVVYGRTVSGFL